MIEYGICFGFVINVNKILVFFLLFLNEFVYWFYYWGENVKGLFKIMLCNKKVMILFYGYNVLFRFIFLMVS